MRIAMQETLMGEKASPTERESGCFGAICGCKFSLHFNWQCRRSRLFLIAAEFD